MKKTIAATAVITCMAIPAVVAAAVPQWNTMYYSTKGLVAIGTYSSKVHGISESNNVSPTYPPNVGKCSSRYVWVIGERRGGQKPIPVSRAGFWSAIRRNQSPTSTESNTGSIPKVTVTGHFTTNTGGIGTWQVHGCRKHSFKFAIEQLGSGA